MLRFIGKETRTEQGKKGFQARAKRPNNFVCLEGEQTTINGYDWNGAVSSCEKRPRLEIRNIGGRRATQIIERVSRRTLKGMAGSRSVPYFLFFEL